MAKSKIIENPAPITSKKIRKIAGIGLKTPKKLSNKQVRALAASVERHVKPKKVDSASS